MERAQLLRALVQVNDRSVAIALGGQLLEKGKMYYGAVFDADSVVSPIATAQLIQTLMCAYVSPGSQYHRSTDILHRMELASQALLNLQHEDGTIDLLTTNFHSTPDLGFTIFPVALSYSLMLQKEKFPYGTLRESIEKYLLRAGDALAVGGIHTPNHRWVVSAALAWIHGFFPDPKYARRIDQWLAEKIDIDPDGQYNERSTAIYTPVTNRCLLDIARKMKYDYLYDVVRKNLEMSLYLVHANGEIVTETSNRRDQYLRRNLSGYYLAYNQLALRDKDARFSGMVEYITRTVPVEHLLYMLPLFLDDPSLLAPLPESVAIPTRYHKHFRYSDLVRIREDKVDMSLITDNPTFFTFFKGAAALEGVRLSSAFFGKGQFRSEEFEKVGETYILSSTLLGPYYQPLPPEKIPEDTDAWTKVPRTERQQSEVQTLRTRVYITPRGGTAHIRVSVDGPDNLPVALELGFRPGGLFSNVMPKTGIDHAFLARNDQYFTYRMGEDTITVGPGVATHKWTQLRGALPKLEGDCVYFTAYAPCEFEFTLE